MLKNSPHPLPPGVTRVREMHGIVEYQLTNGLQILLHHRVDVPTYVALSYRVGSRHENYGETGMAHLLEHMVFKASPRLGGNMLSELERRAFHNNAQTTGDSTLYYAEFAANQAHNDNVEFYIKWLSNALSQPDFIAQHHLDGEKIVVRNEIEGRSDLPQSVLRAEVLAAMFKWHNYGNDIAGVYSDIENVDVSRLKAFYQRYYRPDNATLIVIGELDPSWFITTVNKHFGKIPRPTEPLPKFATIEPIQQGERSVTVRRSSGEPMLFVAYRAPYAAHPDAAASQLLADIMHTRLQRALGVAHVVNGSQLFTEAGLIAFLIKPFSAELLDHVTERALSTLEMSTVVTQQEFQYVREAWLAEWVEKIFDRDSVLYALDTANAWGDWRLHFLLRDAVFETSLADVQRLDRQLLHISNRTLGSYLTVVSSHSAWNEKFIDTKVILRDYQNTWLPVPPPSTEEQLSLDDINNQAVHLTLKNGMRIAVLAHQDDDEEEVTAKWVLRFGDADTLHGQHIFIRFLAEMLRLHDLSLPELRLQVKIASTTQLHILLSARELSTLFIGLRRIIALLQTSEHLSARMFERIRNQLLTSNENVLPEDIELELSILPYPPEHPLHPFSKTQLAREAATLELGRMREMMLNLLGADTALLSISGDLDPTTTQHQLKTLFEHWHAKRPYTPISLDAIIPVSGHRRFEFTPGQQNAEMVVHLILALGNNDEDLPAFYMANHLLADAASSRLWQRLRDRDGLTYGTHGEIIRRPTGYVVWKFSIGFAPSNRAKVEHGFDEEIARVLEKGFEETELEMAKQFFSNTRWMREWTHRQPQAYTTQQIAEALVNTMLDNGQNNRLESLTLSHVNNALRKHLVPDRMMRVFIGDF